MELKEPTLWLAALMEAKLSLLSENEATETEPTDWLNAERLACEVERTEADAWLPAEALASDVEPALKEPTETEASDSLPTETLVAEVLAADTLTVEVLAAETLPSEAEASLPAEVVDCEAMLR